MKKYILALAFLCASQFVSAQEQFRMLPKNVLCGPVETIFKGLADEDINEKPVWIGKDDSEKSDIALFVNQKTGAFTIVQFTKQWGCILGIGNKSETFSGKPL